MSKQRWIDEFAVISNYNTDPSDLVKKFKDVVLYDQSDLDEFSRMIKEKYPKSICMENVGHSLANYFHFVADNYSSLPDRFHFLKSNVSPRHINECDLKRKLESRGVIPIFNDRTFRDKPRKAYHLLPGYFIERNNSWFMQERKPRYFDTCNDLLEYLFIDPIKPEYLLFAPGGNYSVYAENLKRYPLNLWNFLRHITSYQFFPPEAYIVERLLFVIFSSEYELREDNFNEYWREKLESRTKVINAKKNGIYNSKIRTWLKRLLVNKIVFELEKRNLI